MIPQQITDSFVPICAGLFVSLVNKYVLSNPRLDACCTTDVSEDPGSESEDDSLDSTKTELSDTLSKTSAMTTATQPLAHPLHPTHHYYNIHH